MFLNTSQISFQINFHLSIDVKDSISVAACQELDFLKSGRAWQDHLTKTYEVMQRLMDYTEIFKQSYSSICNKRYVK